MKYFISGLALSLATLRPAAAQTAIDFANEYPAGTVLANIADRFIGELSTLSNGDFVVTAHHGGALGYKSVDQFDAVGDGAVQMASSYSGAWSGINPIFLASSLPFLATSIEETRALYEATRPYYEAALAAENQVFLYATPWPPTGLWARKAITTPDDLAGLRIRAADALGVQTLINAGAIPVQLSWADVVPQLTIKGIDGVLTSMDGGISASFWEFLSDFTEINYALPLQVTHMNRDAFDALTPQQQEAVMAASKVAEDYGWSVLVDRLDRNRAKLGEEGVTITTDISPELRAVFEEAAKPVVAKWAAKVGPDATALLESYNSAVGR